MASAWEAGSGPAGQQARDKSVGELLTDLSDELSRLARAEVKLAMIEAKRKAKRASRGAGAFGAAALLSLIGLCVLVASAVLALALVVPGWLAALLVGGAAVVLAGMAALIGRGSLRRALPPVPEWALSSVRTDIETIRKGVHR
jgi:uncharacterized membrane protein